MFIDKLINKKLQKKKEYIYLPCYEKRLIHIVIDIDMHIVVRRCINQRTRKHIINSNNLVKNNEIFYYFPLQKQ